MGIGAAIGVSAAAGIGSSLISGNAATSAANTEASSANYAANLANKAGQNASKLYTPYSDIGTTYGNALTSALPYLTSQESPTFNMTEANLQQTPGYQFTLNQGLESTQNAAAARGLGVSGAALKGASTYATGLADNTYQNQFNNWNTQFQNNQEQQSNIANRLNAGASLGLNATTNQANALIGAASNVGNYLTQGASATAAGTIGAANAASNALQSAGSLPLNYQVLNGMYGSGGGSSSGWGGGNGVDPLDGNGGF